MQVIFTFLRLSVIEQKDIVGLVFVQTHMCSSDCDPLAMFPFKVKKKENLSLPYECTKNVSDNCDMPRWYCQAIQHQKWEKWRSMKEITLEFSLNNFIVFLWQTIVV